MPDVILPEMKLLLLWLLGVPLMVSSMVLARGLTADHSRALIPLPAAKAAACQRQSDQHLVQRAISKQRYRVVCATPVE